MGICMVKDAEESICCTARRRSARGKALPAKFPAMVGIGEPSAREQGRCPAPPWLGAEDGARRAAPHSEMCKLV